MKKFIYLSLFLVIYSTAISQQKLHNGVYLVDKFTSHSYHSKHIHKALITYNTSFVEEVPEEDSLLLIFTDDFVPFEFSMLPVTIKNKPQHKTLLLKLTECASEKLKGFTSKNKRRYVVIVVNNQALTVHRINEPIVSGLVQIASSTDSVYEELYSLLKHHVRE